MNPIDALRETDPARRMTSVDTQARAEALLARLLETAPHPDHDALSAQRRERTNRRRRLQFVSIAAAAVAVAVVGLIASGLTTPIAPDTIGGTATAIPTPTPTPTVPTPLILRAPAPAAVGPVAWNASLAEPSRTLVAADLPACTLKNLTVWSQPQGGGAMETWYLGVFVRNDGPDCSTANAGIRVVVGDGAASAALKSPSSGDSALPTGASEWLQVAHGELCRADPAGANPGDVRQEGLTLVVGSVSKKLDSTYPWGGTCGGLSFNVDGLNPANAFTYGKYPSALPDLKVSIALPAADSNAFEAGTFTGGTLRYTVTIKNSGSHAYTFTTCPSFVQAFRNGRSTVAQRAKLNCAAATPIPANGSESFAMRMNVPAAEDLPPLGWYLIGGAGATD